MILALLPLFKENAKLPGRLIEPENFIVESELFRSFLMDMFIFFLMAYGLFSISANVASFSCCYKAKMVRVTGLEIIGKRQQCLDTL